MTEKIKEPHLREVKEIFENAENLQVKTTSRNLRKGRNFSTIKAPIGGIEDNHEKYVSKNVILSVDFSLVSATESKNDAGIEQKSGESNQGAMRQKINAHKIPSSDDHLHICKYAKTKNGHRMDSA